ncbi:MAG: oligosaccharide flippase family protein [Cyclobacteriaceae bacterium]|nr:oligosaccharide flippase family protein [Cyclobacteriaceae bacterium]
MSIKLIKDTFNYGMGQVLPKVIGFLLIPLYTAYLSPADFGIFDLAITLSAFLLVVMRLSVPGAITRFYYDYKGEQEKIYISSIFWFVLALSFLTCILFLLGGYFFADVLVPGLPYYPFIVLIVISAFLNSGSDIQRRLLQVRQQSAYTAKLNIATALLTILLSISFVVYFKLSALGLVMATVITSFILFIQAQYYLRNDLGGSVSMPMIRESLRFSLVLFPYHLYGHVSTLVTKSILSTFGSLAAVGVLAIATKFTQPFTIIINAFGAAFTPQYLASRTNNLESDYHNLSLLIKRIWFGSTLLFVGFFLFIDWIVIVMTPATYHDAITITKLLSLGFLPQMFYIIFSNELFFRKENKTLLLINMIGISLSLVLSWLLVRSYHEQGAAMAIITPSFVGAVLMFWFTRKKITFHPPWIFIFTCFALSMIIVSVDFFLIQDIRPYYVGLLLKAAMTAAFVLGCFKTDPKIFEIVSVFINKIRKK